MGWQTSVIPLLIAGNTVVINSSGAFFYNGVPALGNLLVSIAPTGGTDPYGNVYKSGFFVATGQFQAGNMIVNSTGLFIYSGTPAAGNLIAVLANAAGTDAFGNAWHWPGLNIIGPGTTSYIAIADNPSLPAVIMNPSGATHLTVQPQIFSSNNNAGAANEISVLALTTGKETGNADAAIQAFSASADNTVGPSIIYEFGGSVAMTMTPAGLLLPNEGGNPAAVGSQSILYTQASGSASVLDSADGQPYTTQRQTQVIGSPVALAAAPGTSPFSIFAAQANGVRNYRIHGQIYVTVSGAAQQLSMGVGVPAGGGGHFGCSLSRAAVLVATSQFDNNVLTGLGAAASLAVGNSYVLLFDGVANIVNNGNIAVTFAATNAGDLTVLTNSFCEFMPC